MRLRAPLTALGLTAALALGGCSLLLPSAPTQESAPATDQSTAPPSDAEPATGELIAGTGYSFNAPEGWTIPPDANPAADVFVISDVDDSDGFTDTINVLLGLGPGGKAPIEQIEAIGKDQLEASGATEVELRPRVTVAGTEAAHFSATFHSQGVDYKIDQYYPTSDTKTYILTFSFGENFPQADREAIAESVLATWAWT